MVFCSFIADNFRINCKVVFQNYGLKLLLVFNTSSRRCKFLYSLIYTYIFIQLKCQSSCDYTNQNVDVEYNIKLSLKSIYN